MATTPPAPSPPKRPEREVPRRDVPDERDPDAPNDEGDVEIRGAEAAPESKARLDTRRSYVGEAGTSSKD